MTNDEKVLIETQFKSLADLFEVKLKASEDIVCEKLMRFEEKFDGMKKVVDEHVEWHNNFNRKVVGFTFKGGMTLFVIIAVIALVVGVKDGFITAVLAKVIG